MCINHPPPFPLCINFMEQGNFLPFFRAIYDLVRSQAIDFGVDEETQLRYSFQIVEKDGRAPYHYDYYNLFDLDKVTGQFSIDTEHRSDPSDLGRYKMKISVCYFDIYTIK